MTDVTKDARDQVRRSLKSEFIRMEDDFDKTRDMRSVLTEKLMSEASKVKLTGDRGEVLEETDTGIRLISVALKALSDSDKANSQAIMLKLKHQEQEIASSAAAKDRIAVVIQATAPGQIPPIFPTESLEQTLEEMFGDDIKDSELKTNPRSLDETNLDG